MRKKNNKYIAILNDLLMITIGIIFTIIIANTGLLDIMVKGFREYYILASFFTGIFFTSIFTISPSSVMLARIAENAPHHGVAIWGAMGAMCGDLVLFFFIRDRFTVDIMNMVKKSTIKQVFHSLHFGFMKWLSPLLGALIIASPLPDEFAMTLLGMSKVRMAVLIPLSFIMNMLGIYALIGFSNLL